MERAKSQKKLSKQHQTLKNEENCSVRKKKSTSKNTKSESKQQPVFQKSNRPITLINKMQLSLANYIKTNTSQTHISLYKSTNQTKKPFLCTSPNSTSNTEYINLKKKIE